MTTKFKIGDRVEVRQLRDFPYQAVILEIDSEDDSIKVKDDEGWVNWVHEEDLTSISSAEDTQTTSILELQAAITTMEATLAAMKESVAKINNQR